MSAPISIRLDESVQVILDDEAKRRKIGISTLIREIATEAAKEVRRKRVREGSEAVARHIKKCPEAAEFFEFWGTPRIDGL